MYQNKLLPALSLYICAYSDARFAQVMCCSMAGEEVHKLFDCTMYIMFYNNDLCSINHQLKRILKSEIQKGF
jgi:hypothetical protein